MERRIVLMAWLPEFGMIRVICTILEDDRFVYTCSCHLLLLRLLSSARRNDLWSCVVALCEYVAPTRGIGHMVISKMGRYVACDVLLDPPRIRRPRYMICHAVARRGGCQDLCGSGGVVNWAGGAEL